MGEIHKNMNGEGIIFLAVDCVPTKLPKEVGNVFHSGIYMCTRKSPILHFSESLPYEVEPYT
jgi:hypothetical protein